MGMMRGKTFAIATILSLLAGCEATVDWWLTPDQHGHRLYEQGNYSAAARAFEDPLWKGVAFYAAEEFASASAMLAPIDSAYARFYLGNSFAQRDLLAEAAEAYRQALQMQPSFAEAEFNLNWVSGLLELEQREYDDYGGTGGKLGADGFVFDDRAQNAQQTMTDIEAQTEGLTDAQIEDIWMRRVQTTPADFLAIKFAYQLAEPATGEAE